MVSLNDTYRYFTMSWGPGNHSKLTPGGRPMFLKAKLYKESRNGFKTINYRRYPVMIFSKNWFSAQKIIKKLDVLLIFEFLCQSMCSRLIYFLSFAQISLISKKLSALTLSLTFLKNECTPNHHSFIKSALFFPSFYF